MFFELVLVDGLPAFGALFPVFLGWTRTFFAMLLHIFDFSLAASTANERQTCEPMCRELAFWKADAALVACASLPWTNV